MGLATVAVAAGLAAPPSARAGTQWPPSCESYTYSCDNTGYQGQVTWGFQGGHNCTTYVAWRLQHEGVQPPPGVPTSLGNAGEWMGNAESMGIPVDGTPTVGSVAWWGPNQGVKGEWHAGPSGHVAFVIQVKSPTDIVVAEDNCCSGPLDIREVWAGDAVWPGAFIHFHVPPPPPPPGPPGANDDPPGGAAVVHNGYTSVYTVNADQTLEETYLAANGQPWATQNMSANYGTPPVAAGTTPVAIFHGGYTSVFTVNAADHTLQETYLSALGQPWATQNLSANYGTPPVAAGTTPAVVFHNGFTSVYTVNAADNTLQETYLSAVGQPWATQNMSANYGTPPVAAGTSPAALYHTGYTSVFTVNAADNTLQETYLSALGQPWVTQSLSANYGTPPVAAGTTPAPVLHTDAAGNLNFTSVYTVNAADNTLQETYLGAPGQPWHTQSMSVGAGTPLVAAGTSPQALYHTGYTSVYTVNAADNTLQETYLPVNGGAWHTQSLSANFGTPAVAAGTTPVALVHPDHSGVMDFTSVYTINASGNTLQETYLSAIGQPWVTQTLTTPPTTSNLRQR
jgi:surface antigen